MGRANTIGVKCKLQFQADRILDADPRAPKDREKIPGPGQYETSSRFLRNSPNYTIGLSKTLTRNDSNFSNPGVGDYNPNKTTKRAPQFTMAAKSSTGKANAKIPGPGEYDLSPSMSRNNGFT